MSIKAFTMVSQLPIFQLLFRVFKSWVLTIFIRPMYTWIRSMDPESGCHSQSLTSGLWMSVIVYDTLLRLNSG